MMVFSEDGKIDTFTVPTSGTYVITVIGATGGGLGPGYAGGAGAEVEGTFTLSAGDVLYVLVGGAGSALNGGAGSGGGGGASAGSGGSGSPGGPGKPGEAGTSGSAGNNYVNGFGTSYGGAGGTDGSGGGAGTLEDGAVGTGSGGGGGGFSGSGADGDFGDGGASFLAGGAGGTGAALDTAHSGGFGGGGGANSDSIGAGGGGGYSGGGGGEEDIGGGGGSYVAPVATDVTLTGGENADGNGTVEITPCFLAGTLIATQAGETPVERLAVGDMVRTAAGAVRPIAWIGKGRVLATRGRRNAATPVIVSKGALGPNIPHHDLRVTKGHSFYLDGVLIPVEFLVNHRSIRWDDRAQEVVHYHIELETHDVLLANGAPAESYRDDGNRWLFQNANSGWHLPPKPPCAPVLTGGPVVDAVWCRLLDRAGPRPRLPTTNDPDLHLLVEGRRIDAASVDGMSHIFRLPTRPEHVRIVSRASVPQELGTARDPRALGVAVRQILATHGQQIRRVEAASGLLTQGFHGFEPDDAIRWTDGDAVIPASLFDGCAGPVELALRLGGTTSYAA
jgi:hypothetical protein